MKAKSKNWCLLCLLCLVCLCIAGCFVRSDIERQEWFRCAAEYDKALNEMWESGLWDDYRRVKKSSRAFLRAKEPTETEILSLVQSPNARFKNIGLAAMSIKPIETDGMTDTLFGFLQDDDHVRRWYAISALKKFSAFPQPRQGELARQLLEIIKPLENSDKVAYIPLFAKLPSDETVHFLTEQFMNEGEMNLPLLRVAAHNTLKEMGLSYYDQAASYINEHGSPEAKERLLEMDQDWAMFHGE